MKVFLYLAFMLFIGTMLYYMWFFSREIYRSYYKKHKSVMFSSYEEVLGIEDVKEIHKQFDKEDEPGRKDA